jgi:starch-binding outer membrane protein, SusD/RagB family
MKQTYQFLLALTALFLFSCKKQLEEKPYSIISPATYYKTQADFETGTIGVIGLMSNALLYGQYLHYPVVYPSGDYDSPFYDINTMSYTSTSVWAMFPWDAQYRVIDNCNSVLSKIDGVDFDAEKKAALKGELIFLRANAYFDMVRMYGGVPISLAPTTTLDSVSKPRATTAQTYQVIIDDLKNAAGILPVVNPYGAGRATKGSAAGLLVKVYVQMAGRPLNDAAKWQEALTLVETLVNTSNPSTAASPYTYHLEADYQKLFWNVARTRVGGTGLPTIAAPANENGPESVYEINYKNVSGYPSCIYPESLAGITCSQWLADKFDPLDYRKRVTMVVDASDPLGGIRLHRKFQSTGDTYNNSDNNWPVLRFTDLVLLLAEAENEINGPTPLALSAINAVRARARNGSGTPSAIPANYTAADAGTKDQLRLLIEKERIIELSCEGQTWYDWIRTNRLQAIMTEQGRGLFYNADHELFPVPQGQIDITQGVLVQNPGY